MDLESGNKIDQNKPPEAEEKASEGRRKLIRGALVGAPILLALKSSPVLACNCKLPSGFSTSGNLSRNGGATCTQPAYKPSYWKSHYNHSTKKFSGIYSSTIKTTTPFKDVFGGNDARTFLEVLGLGDTVFSALVAAAYLGIKAGHFVSGVSESNIKQMWSNTYIPLGNTIPWNAIECTDYLKYVMGLPL